MGMLDCKIATCDLCRHKELLKECKNDDGWCYFDGEKYWGYNERIGYMCPTCYSKYKTVLDEFAEQCRREVET